MFHLIVKIYFLWRERYFRGTLPEFHTRTESGLHPFERQLPIAQRATFAPVPLHSPASCAHLYEQFRRPDDSGKLMAPVPLLPQLQSVVRRSSSALPWSPCPQTRQIAPPDVEEIAEAYCMETLDRPARLAFEDHYLVCPQCASVVASTDEYVRSMRTALERLRMERKTGEGEVA